MLLLQWYGIVLGGLLASATLFYTLCLGFPRVFTLLTFCFLKYIFYPQLPLLLRGSGKATRFDIIPIIILIVINVSCITIGAHSLTEFINRTALASAVNLVPLFFGGRMNAIASHCGLTYDTYSRLHRWTGRISLAEGLVHSIIAFISNENTLNDKRSITGIVALASALATLSFSIGPLRRYFHEIFANLHWILTLVLLGSVWLHTPSQKALSSPRVFLLTALCVKGLTMILRFLQILHRNFKLPSQTTQAEIEPLKDATLVRVRVARPWKYRAGQYIYLCIPGISTTSILQFHPFYISWWYRDGDQDVLVLIVQQRSGLTANLMLQPKGRRRKAIIEGPYGKDMSVDKYGTILLFATGLGIAGQLPYLKEVMEGYQKRDVKTRRVALFWEIESEAHKDWVEDMMNDLLSLDIEFILEINVFVLGEFKEDTTLLGDVYYPHKRNPNEPYRVIYNYSAMNVETLLQQELQEHTGRAVLVSMCTRGNTNNVLRESVCQLVGNGVVLRELEFRPFSSLDSESTLKFFLLRKEDLRQNPRLAGWV